MRRLVLLLTLLLIWPLAASAQIVSPGGGNFTGAIAGGNCTPPEVMGGISGTGVPTCVPSGATGAALPPGNVPQIVGYSATNIGEAETVSGDLSFTRAGANSYVATVTQLNGAIPGGVCGGNQFVNAINASGVPQCATPTAGGGTPLPNPTTAGEILGTNGTDAEWAIVSGGPGNCGFTRTALGAYTLTCSDYVPSNNANFTGTFTINGAPLGGTCPVGEYVTLISGAGVPTCSPLPAPAPGSISDSMLTDAYSGVGSCTAGEFVTGLNRAAAPTCAIVPAGGGVIVAATAPATPTIGMLWFDTVSIQLFIWFNDGTGSHWVPTINQAVNGPAPVPPTGPAVVTVSDVAPAAPVEGSLWFDTTNVQMYVWYTSGTSSQWAPVAHP